MSRKVNITLIDGDDDHIINQVDVMSGVLGERMNLLSYSGPSTMSEIAVRTGDQFVVIMAEECDWLFEGTEEELIGLAEKADSVD